MFQDLGKISFFILTFFFFTGFSSVFAQEPKVSINKLKENCFEGENLGFAVIIESNENIEADFSQLQYDGQTIPVYDKDVSQSSFTRIINNKVYESKSIKTTYIFLITPTKTGPLVIPATKFKVQDKWYDLPELKFTVFEIQSDPNLGFFIRILNQRPVYYTNEVFEVEFVFALREYRDFAGVMPEVFGFDWIQQMGLELIPEANPTHTIQLSNRNVKIILKNESNHPAINQYKGCFAFTLKFRAKIAGQYPLENCLTKVKVSTNQTKIVNDFFQRKKVYIDKVIYAKHPLLNLKIEEIPQENKPAFYSGAIGIYDIEVIPSSDVGVKVGDPITLICTIKGKGDWEDVHAPPVHLMKDITDYFRVSEDLPIGTVSENKQSKEFLIKLRVKSKAVKSVPSIPFSYFNLHTKKYETKYSKEVPLKVFENQSSVKINDFSDQSAKEGAEKIAENHEVNKNEIKSIDKETIEKIDIHSVFADNHLSVNHVGNKLLLYLSLIPLAIGIAILLVSKSTAKKLFISDSPLAKKKKAVSSMLQQFSLIKPNEEQWKLLGACIEQYLVDENLQDKSILENINLDSFISLGLDKNKAAILLEMIDTIDGFRYGSKPAGENEFHQIMKKLKDTFQ